MPSLRRRREDNSISAELWNRRVVLTRDSLLTLIREDEIKIPFLPSACIFLTHVKKMGMYPKLPFQSRTLCLISCKVPVRKEAIVLRNAFPVPSRDITIEANISHTTRRVYILHTRMYYPLLARHHLPNSKLLTSVGSHEHDLWWQNTLARILFILSPCWRSRWPKRKFRNFKVWELPSQNQEFLTHSVELPVHRTWQLSFSFREAKQLVHPIEVSSEVPWICKEAHTRMRPAALSSLPPALILSCRPH